MNRREHLPELSNEQWAFWAVLAAFDIPVSIDLAGYLAPLLPGPLFDLMEKTQPPGWIKKYPNNRFGIGERLPGEAQSRIRSINTAEHLKELARKITEGSGLKKADLREKLNLLNRVDMLKEAGECEVELAHLAMRENRQEECVLYLEHAVNRFVKAIDKKGVESCFSRLFWSFPIFAFLQGEDLAGEKFWIDMEIADRLGDRRARVRLNLHLGRLCSVSIVATMPFRRFRSDSKKSKNSVTRTSASSLPNFSRISFFIQGRLREALDRFFGKIGEGFAISSGLFPDQSPDPVFPGILCGHGRKFRPPPEVSISIGAWPWSWRTRLGPALSGCSGHCPGPVEKRQGREYIFSKPAKRLIRVKNALGQYLAGGGVSLYYFRQGQVEKAYELLKETLHLGMSAGLIRQFASPLYLEMIYEFHRLGFEPLPKFGFPH